jgi:hypothetical protein|tara:strand:+ start:1543 stop:2427 length:885 start_codon:yes stop_codon:yes gene_type:complete
MNSDRDAPIIEKLGKSAFAAFSRNKRAAAYYDLHWADQNDFPELDILLLEWRNNPVDAGQRTRLLDWYSGTGTAVIVIDLDHGLTEEDEVLWRFDMVLEPSLEPREFSITRHSAFLPFDINDLRQFPMLAPEGDNLVVYVGTQKDKEESMDLCIAPLGKLYPNQIHFWGDWDRKRWPSIVHHSNANSSEFREIYGRSVLTPLLCKTSFDVTGNITSRLSEALLFGTLPIGFESNIATNEILPIDCIAEDHWDILAMLKFSLFNKPKAREFLRNKIIERLEPLIDVRLFVDKILL